MANIEKRGEYTYRLTVSLGFGPDGKHIRKRKTIKVPEDLTGKRLKAYLEEQYVRFRQEVMSGTYIEPERMRLEEFISVWEDKYARNKIAPSTLEIYRMHLKNHILPVFGNIPLSNIKPFHIVTFIADLHKKNLSSNTVAYIYRVLKNVLARAAEWKLIPENPVASVQRPNAEPEVGAQFYNEEEVEQVMRALQDEPPHWRMFFTLALAAGLRRGELLALEWSHVDLDVGTIRIEQAVSRGEKGRAFLRQPKTQKSKRTVSIPQSVVDELRTYRRHWVTEKLAIGDGWVEHDHDFLFHRGNGQLMYPTSPDKWWRNFIARHGLRFIRIHDLRHTSASLLIAAGVHARVIAERLGHADTRTTMEVYGHVLREADEKAAAALNDLFRKRADGG